MSQDHKTQQEQKQQQPTKRKHNENSQSQSHVLHFTARNPPWTYLKLQLYDLPSKPSTYPST